MRKRIAQRISEMKPLEWVVVIAVLYELVAILGSPFLAGRKRCQILAQNWVVSSVDYQTPMIRSSFDHPKPIPIYTSDTPWTITLTADLPMSPIIIKSGEKFEINEVVHFARVKESEDPSVSISAGEFDPGSYQLVHGPRPIQ